MTVVYKKNFERRHHHKRDVVQQSVNGVNLVSLISLFISYVVLYAAKPDYYWDRKQKTANPNLWNEELMEWFIYATYIALVFAIIGMLVNLVRTRRQSDSYRLNLFLVIIFSIFNVIFYIIYF